MNKLHSILLVIIFPLIILGVLLKFWPGTPVQAAPLDRPLYATLVVTSVLDAGPGTLRQVMLNADAGDTIIFDPGTFPPGSPATIAPLSPLPDITQGNLTIDGAGAGVILDGSVCSQDWCRAFFLLSDGNTIRGLRILNFPADGILVDNSKDNLIADNQLSGNGFSGITVQGNGAENNTISGNLIGTDLDGITAIPNLGNGIDLINGANNNIVGGSIPADRNVISGNARDGVLIVGSTTLSNIVSGNYIGTDINGTSALSNGGFGVHIREGAQDNIVGGDTAGERNIISGNSINGVVILGNGTNNNVVSGNYIGTDVDGVSSIPNTWGILIRDGAQFNVIGGTTPGERNVISGNTDPGYSAGIGISGASTENNKVIGNYVGTNATGTVALGNGGGPTAGAGVTINEGASQNSIGGDAPAERNLISGNDGVGVQILFDASNNTVSGNYIGTDSSGTNALPNTGYGVQLGTGSNNNIIGGDNISPGGACAGECNLISGNDSVGVSLENNGTESNIVSGNYIGTDVSGTSPLGNNSSGIALRNGAAYNRIGSTTPEERNLISANGSGIGNAGVWIQDSGTVSNTLAGNLIGTDVTGTSALSNNWDGVFIGVDASNNTVGGSTPAEGNLISGNSRVGVSINGQNFDTSANTVQGNTIGVDVTGTSPLGNGLVDAYTGLEIFFSADNIIEDNLISGNYGRGISVQGNTSLGNVIRGNTIGTDISGTSIISNTSAGVSLSNGAQRNLIGGDTPVDGNLISGNDGPGIEIADTGTISNVVSGNIIGADVSGTTSLGNDSSGVLIENGASQNTVGISNTIAFNRDHGVEVDGNDTLSNTITQNSIFNNVIQGIALSDGGNLELFAPIVTDTNLSAGLASGTACSLCRVEIFSDAANQGRSFEGSTTANAAGQWSLDLDESFAGPQLTATATDAAGNTSEFSDRPPVTCTVTNSEDSGSGTLRMCLEDAVGGDTITFDSVTFPPNSPATIFVATPLPNIGVDNLTIDGSNTGVILDGSALIFGHGFVIDGADGVEIKGLQILNFPDDGIRIQNGASNNTIGGVNGSPGGACSGDCNLISGNGDFPGDAGIKISDDETRENVVTGNYIGTDITGNTAFPNHSGVILWFSAQENTIGGSSPGERNIISGNNSGIGIQNGGTVSNTVRGNFVGVNSSGTAAVGNSGSGFDIFDGAQYNLIGGTTPGERNIISGNGNAGIDIRDSGTTYNVVSGNYIGTDVNGTAIISNAWVGVSVKIGAQFNRIGGSNASPGGNCTGECNVISGNGDNGVRLDGLDTQFNVVIGNYIGTDATGTTAIGNVEDGVAVNETQFNQIGGNTLGESNLISGNGETGVNVREGSIANTIVGNFIGTAASGSTALPNLTSGVLIEEGSSQNIVGNNNTIAFNGGHGVQVDGSDTLTNTITQNSIYANTDQGIELSNGGNTELPAPVISASDLSAGQASGTACPFCTVEIFSDDADEGRWFEGSTTADATGQWNFDIGASFTGSELAATATDVAGNTSEFLNDMTVTTIDPFLGGELTSPDGQVNLVFPSGAVTQTTTITVTTANTTTRPTVGFQFAGQSFDITATDINGDLVTSFNNPFTLTVIYEDSDWQSAGVINEDDLDVYFWKDPLWEALLPCSGCAHNTIENRFTIPLDHLTEFALLAQEQGVVPVLSIVGDGTDVELAWTTHPSHAGYEVHRSITPFFTPDSETLLVSLSAGTASYTDTGVAGNTDLNYFYAVRALGSGNIPTANSDEVGEIDYPLNNAGGQYSMVAVPFTATTIIDAASLTDAIGDVAALLKWNPTTQTFQFFVPPSFGDNFTLTPGEPAFVQLNSSSSSVVTMVGEVMEVQHGMTPGGFNFISLPLQRAGLTLANEIAADMGGVNTMLSWNETTQSFRFFVPPSFGDNFSVQPGMPFIVDLDAGGSTSWP